MPPYIDPARRARAATIALGIYVAMQSLELVAAAFAGPDGTVAGVAALLLFATMIGAMVAVGMWIYRVNANAHTFANGLSITPGWNVGWFFVPFANLWKPFQGVKETWQASANPHHWPDVPVPGILRGWWGCWLIGNILANASFRSSRVSGAGSIGMTLDLVSSASMIVAGVLLIQIIGQLTRMQDQASASEVFA